MTHDYLLLRYELASGTPMKGTLRALGTHYYGRLTTGHRRFWEAVQNDSRIDMSVEIPGDRSVTAGQYVYMEGAYWRIEEAQHTTDDDGLEVVRLALRRWGGDLSVVRTD